MAKISHRLHINIAHFSVILAKLIILNTIDGVAKSPIYCVVAGTANARRTICTPPLGRHHYALYIELLCLAILTIKPTFYEFITIKWRKGTLLKKNGDGMSYGRPSIERAAGGGKYFKAVTQIRLDSAASKRYRSLYFN